MNALPHIETFRISGPISVLAAEHALRKGAGGHVPTRPLGGWVTTYGKLGPDGGVIPTVDREDMVMECAKALGMIDWRSYVRGGHWNDAHNEPVKVGVPVTLEFHDGTTPLSKSHGKVGFWSTGHLFDGSDPDSWRAYTTHQPTPKELDRSDFYWNLAKALDGTDRGLAFSAHGEMALSPCKRRILWARIREAAVCQVPMNPDATVEVLTLAKAVQELGPLLQLRKSQVEGNPCARCRCPAGSCGALLLQKARSGDLFNQPSRPTGGTTVTPETRARLISLVQQFASCTKVEAAGFVDFYLKNRRKPGTNQGIDR